MRKIRLICAAAIVCVATCSGAFAASVTLDFNNDAFTGGESTISSVDSALVTFSSTDPTGVVGFSNFANQAFQTAVGTSASNPAGLRFDFSVKVNSLSMLFGNDDPNFAEDRAVLTVFNSGLQVGQTVLIYNKNDLPDETISVSGVGVFDAATLVFADSTGVPVSALGEVVDNVTFNTVTPVPLPAAGWMLVAGLGGLAAMRRRKKP